MWPPTASAVSMRLSETTRVSRRTPGRTARTTSPARATLSCQTRSSRTPEDMARMVAVRGEIPASEGCVRHLIGPRARLVRDRPDLLLPGSPCDNFHKLNSTLHQQLFPTPRMATETTLRPGEIKDILLREIEAADLHELDVEEVGSVLEVKDGIARIYGLGKAMAGEMLEVHSSETGNNIVALALNLEEDNIGTVVRGDYLQLKEGDEVRRTGRVLEVTVGPALVGRVVDALGRPIDGNGHIHTAFSRKVESEAPGIFVRQPVKEPLQTGIKAIDSMIPIGRGQRQHILGDLGICKTAIAHDTILNQKGPG